MKKMFLSLLLLSSLSNSTLPISYQTCMGITAGAGIAATGGTWFLLNKAGVGSAPFWGLGVGGLSAWLAYYIAYGYTPEGRYARASQLNLRIQSNPLSLQPFENEAEFYDVAEDFYVASDWWLVDAFNELTELLNAGRESMTLLDDVQAETASRTLLNDARILKESISRAVVNLATALKFIRNHKDYMAQMKEYKRMLIEREKMAIEQQKANAQWHMALR